LAILGLLAAAPPALAGTICGTVRDAQTNQPVARALVLVRTPDGAYTGLHGGSDLSGHYCVADVPAGTFDLEFRVDNYAVGYVTGVVVDVDQSGVDVVIRASSVRLSAPSPNPAVRFTTLSFTLATPLVEPVRLTVHDALGRLVTGWEAVSGSTTHVVEWDLRDRDGTRVAPGVYFVRLVAGAEQRTTRLAVVE